MRPQGRVLKKSLRLGHDYQSGHVKWRCEQASSVGRRLERTWWHSQRSQMPQKTVYWNQPTAGTSRSACSQQLNVRSVPTGSISPRTFVTAAKPLGTSENFTSLLGERNPADMEFTASATSKARRAAAAFIAQLLGSAGTAARCSRCKPWFRRNSGA